MDRGRGRGRGAQPGGGGSRGGSPRGGSPSGRGSPNPRGGPQGRGGGGGFRGGRGGGPSAPLIFREGQPLRIPDHLSNDNQNKLIAVLKKVPPSPQRPVRPGFGTIGTPITLRANFFRISCGLDKLYEYSINIEPKDHLKKHKQRLFELIEESPQVRPHRPYIAHDGMQRLIAAKKIPDITLTVPFYEKGQNGPQPNADHYTVSVVFTKDLDMKELKKYLDGNAGSRSYDPLPIVSALNLVFADSPQRMGVRVGQNKYYFAPQNRMILGMGIEAWRGYFLSVRPTFKNLAINMNTTMAPFVQPGNLADILLAFKGNAGGLPTLPKQLAKSIKITTTHLGYRRRYTLAEIGSRSAKDVKFVCDEFGKQPISVEVYFQKKYRKNLKHAGTLPVVNVGSSKRPTWLPAEICEVEAGNPYRGRLSDREVANMMNVACNPPGFNADNISSQGFTLNRLTDFPLKDEFKLSVDPDMMGIPARILPPPKITYKGPGSTVPRMGSWNITQAKFVEGATVKTWWVLLVQDKHTRAPVDKADVLPMVKGFGTKLVTAGMKVLNAIPTLVETSPLEQVNRDPGRLASLAHIKEKLQVQQEKTGKPSFILVLLSHRDNFIYSGIKKICDMDLGLITVCMQLEKALVDGNRQDQYFSNVALKVNTKLGGINHKLDPANMKFFSGAPTMCIGIDVTHPGPGSRWGTPSIAAVVGSVDSSFVQYYASMRIQKPDENKMSKEVVADLEGMARERVQVFKEKNRRYPERIFVFRDGVSEGQYDIVIREEYSKIRVATQSLQCNPKVTIIICGKRHHARFYPVDSKDADKNGNTLPGTVVDKGVTGVFDFDFYLQAHAGLKGTVKPTHYNVIYDENNLGADDIQVGTHNASHLYARATKAVSLIPAAYYADLACERGRLYLNKLMLDDTTTTAGGQTTRSEEAEQTWRSAVQLWGNGLHEDTKKTMFYI